MTEQRVHGKGKPRHFNRLYEPARTRGRLSERATPARMRCLVLQEPPWAPKNRRRCVTRLQSSAEAADWVHKNLAVKNTLMAADADSVVANFRKGYWRWKQDLRSPKAKLILQRMMASRLRAGRLSWKRWMFRRRPRSFCRRSLLAVAAVAWPQKRSGFATRNTADISQPSPASCAGGRQAKRTTFASLSRVRSAARSARNTRSPSAASSPRGSPPAGRGKV
jgi:hypothetical protein